MALYCRQHRGRKSARGEIRGGHLCVQRTQNAGCFSRGGVLRENRDGRRPLERVVDQEEADGRFNTPEAKAANHKGRTYFADMHRVDLKDDDQWMAKQVYLNVGNFLLGVAALGTDAVPIEGFDAAILDEEFGLKKASPAVVVPVGHHSVEDFNATLPKSRLPLSTIVTEC